MNELYFEIEDSTYYNLPVEVWNSDLILVHRCLSSQSVKLDTGVYYITSRLPSGDMLYGRAEINNRNQTVLLTPNLKETFLITNTQQLSQEYIGRYENDANENVLITA